MVSVKKIIPILIAVLVAGAGLYAVTTKPPEGGKKTELLFWHTYEFGPEMEAIEILVNEFMRTHPDIKIKVEKQAFAEAPTKFILAAKAGKAPDVMRLQNDRVGDIAELGIIEPLDGYVDETLLGIYLDITVKAMSWGGKLWGLPASFDCLGLVYNKDLVPDPPQTTEELIQLAKTLTSGEIYGFITPVRSSYWFFPWLYGFGGKIFHENGDPAINSPEAVKTVEWLMSLVKEHKVMPEPTVEIMNTKFIEKKAAMIVQGPWFIGDAIKAGVNVGVTRLPKVSETGKWPAPLIGVKGYIMSSTCENKEAAFEFIKFLTSEYACEVFAEVAKTFPAVETVLTKIEEDPILQGFADQAEIGTPMPSDPLMGAIWEPLDTALQKIYGGLSIQEALDEAQAEILARG